MAGNSEAQQDMQAHIATYSGVIAMLKYGAVAAFLVGFLVIFLIAK